MFNLESSVSDLPKNIERFNLTALQLFSELYSAFPNEITVETAMLGAEAAPIDTPPTEHMRYAMSADQVVHWLAEEGFVRIKGHQSGTEIHGVRLTLKGLTVLGYVPASLKQRDPKEPLITKINRVLANGAEKAGTEGVKAILSGACPEFCVRGIA